VALTAAEKRRLHKSATLSILHTLFLLLVNAHVASYAQFTRAFQMVKRPKLSNSFAVDDVCSAASPAANSIAFVLM